jgi:hypothetical protein
MALSNDQNFVLEAAIPADVVTAAFAKPYGCDAGPYPMLAVATFIACILTMSVMFFLPG